MKEGEGVWVVTSGSGDDGDEWRVEGIYPKEQLAIDAKARYEAPRQRSWDGSFYSQEVDDIIEWRFDDKDLNI